MGSSFIVFLSVISSEGPPPLSEAAVELSGASFIETLPVISIGVGACAAFMGAISEMTQSPCESPELAGVEASELAAGSAPPFAGGGNGFSASPSFCSTAGFSCLTAALMIEF